MKNRIDKTSKTVVLAAAIITCIIQICGCQTKATSMSDLAAGFISPPDSAKPLTWWHWMNGNVTKEGITLDLEKMKEVGIGGFQIFDVGQGIPQGPVKYLSPEWLELMQWAAKEADRLGLEYDVHNCPGWSSTGGPWVTPEYGMQNLVWSEAAVTGGTRVTITLTQPSTNLNYYRDAFVLAFPNPPADTQPVRVTSNSGDIDIKLLAGGQSAGGVEIRPVDANDPNKPGYLQLEYAEPVNMRQITLSSVSLAQPANAGARGARGAGSSSQISLEVSDDGLTFRSVATISGAGRGGAGGRGGGAGMGGITETPKWYVTNQPRPKSERVTFTMYKYYSKDSPLLESGLIGPVKLISAIQRTID